MTIETIRFKGDSATRRRFFVAESFAHPAKMASGLFLECLERYSKPGDWILDCMAGSGTALLGAMYGRNVILNELELHFILPILKSWAKIQQNGPALGCTMGEALILRGDARCLPLPDASVGAAITSPPYEGIVSDNKEGPSGHSVPGGWKANTVNKHGGYTRPVDTIVTSPPWEDKTGQITDWVTEQKAAGALRTGEKGDPWAHKRYTDGYTRPVDAIVTSPPFERSLASGGTVAPHDTTGFQKADYDTKVPYNLRGFLMKHAGIYDEWRQTTNIGNLRNAAYWDSMRQVYAECWRVLRPGGILALVLKGFTRDGKYVDLPGQTEALLLEAGWVKHDHWRRELWSLSFWRILQKRRDPAAFDERLNFEEVLAFRKPEGAGNGVDAVITSPPYEGFTEANDEQRTHARASNKEVADGLRFGKRKGYTRPKAPR